MLSLNLGTLPGAPLLTVPNFSLRSGILSNKLPAGAIVGISLALFSLVILVPLFVWLRRWGQRNHKSHHFGSLSPFLAAGPVPVQEAAVAHSAGPTDTDNSDTRSICTIRQRQLQDQLHTTQEKMVFIEGSEPQTVPTGAATERLLRLLSVRNPLTSARNGRGSGKPSDLESQLEASKQRNERLAARIRELEAQMQSDWAMGLSDEPPPGYAG